jgi:hypothetical protein
LLSSFSARVSLFHLPLRRLFVLSADQKNGNQHSAMSLAQQAKNSSMLYLVLSVVVRWGYNALFLLYKGFTPMQHAVLHMICALIGLALAFMAIQLFRKSAPSGSNLGCLFLALLLVNFVFAVGSVFAALIHLFGANGGEMESIWLM